MLNSNISTFYTESPPSDLLSSIYRSKSHLNFRTFSMMATTKIISLSSLVLSLAVTFVSAGNVVDGGSNPAWTLSRLNTGRITYTATHSDTADTVLTTTTTSNTVAHHGWHTTFERILKPRVTSLADTPPAETSGASSLNPGNVLDQRQCNALSDGWYGKTIAYFRKKTDECPP